MRNLAGLIVAVPTIGQAMTTAAATLTVTIPTTEQVTAIAAVMGGAEAPVTEGDTGAEAGTPSSATMIKES